MQRQLHPLTVPKAGHRFSWTGLLLAIVITFAVTSMAWMVLGYLTLNHRNTYDVPPFAVSLDFPEEVVLGERFTVKASVENTSAQLRVWSSLDVYDEFLQYFRLEDAQPAIRHRQNFYGYTVFGFEQMLEPGATASVELTFQANQAGSFGGNFDFCDAAENYVTAYAEIEVIEP